MINFVKYYKDAQKQQQNVPMEICALKSIYEELTEEQKKTMQSRFEIVLNNISN